MLILSRHKNERVVIGDDGAIEVCVVEIRGDKVRLGFEAPKEISVHRSEVYAAIRRDAAADPKPDAARPTIVSAAFGQLVLQFDSDTDLRAAVAAGQVSFAQVH